LFVRLGGRFFTRTAKRKKPALEIPADAANLAGEVTINKNLKAKYETTDIDGIVRGGSVAEHRLCFPREVRGQGHWV